MLMIAPDAVLKHCPKCGTPLQPPVPADGSCPHCGIWFAKIGQPLRRTTPPDPDAILAAAAAQARDPLGAHGRLIILLLLALWSVRLITYDYRDGEMGQSFMHLILLVIHEAGHVFLIPFGEFMTILGGSLFQLALPFGIGLAFLLRQRDPYGAALCLWWTGTSLLDLAPYIFDALHPQLIMLGGHTGEDGPHDWIYLLGRCNLIEHAHGLGKTAHHLGALLMAGSLLWAALTIHRTRLLLHPR